MKNTNEVISEKRILDSYLKVDEAIIKRFYEDGTTTEIKRFKVNKPDAVVIFVYNKDKQTAVFVKQYRYPVIEHTDGKPVLEVVAGVIDEGESPLESAKRETLEEAGYRVKDENIQEIFQTLVAPGYISEKFYFFHAIVTDEDKVEDGGGLEEEHEDIEVIEIPYVNIPELIQKRDLIDAKSILAFYFVNHKPHFNLHQ